MQDYFKNFQEVLDFCKVVKDKGDDKFVTFLRGQSIYDAHCRIHYEYPCNIHFQEYEDHRMWFLREVYLNVIAEGGRSMKKRLSLWDMLRVQLVLGYHESRILYPFYFCEVEEYDDKNRTYYSSDISNLITVGVEGIKVVKGWCSESLEGVYKISAHFADAEYNFNELYCSADQSLEGRALAFIEQETYKKFEEECKKMEKEFMEKYKIGFNEFIEECYYEKDSVEEAMKSINEKKLASEGRLVGSLDVEEGSSVQTVSREEKISEDAKEELYNS